MNESTDNSQTPEEKLSKYAEMAAQTPFTPEAILEVNALLLDFKKAEGA